MLIHKIVILGRGGVGKSAITTQYVYGTFIKKYDPTIEDCYHKTVNINDTEYYLYVVDTAGTEQFIATRDYHLKDADGYMLVFSVLSKNSLSYLEEILDSIFRNTEIQMQDLPCIIVGNKCDLKNRIVSTIEAEEKTKEWGLPYIETSAKTNININEAFEKLILLMPKNEKIRLEQQKSCCILF